VIRTPYSIRFRDKLIWIIIGMAIGIGVFSLIGGNTTTKTVVIHPEEEASPPASTSRSATPGESVRRSSRPPAADPATNMVRRYEKIVAAIEEGGGALAGLGFTGDLQPDEWIAEFFDLTPEEFDRLKEIGERTAERYERREKSLAKVVPSDEHDYACEIDADPFVHEVREQFTEELKSLVGEDGARLLAASASSYFGELKTRRRLTFDVVKLDSGTTEHRYRMTTLKDNGEEGGTSSGHTFSFSGSSPKGQVDPRYKHLLELE
jgi:hypothetical protein